MRRFPWMLLGFVLLAAYPAIPGLNEGIRGTIDTSLGARLTTLFVYGMLALGLHLIVGLTGMFHLGIGAFFGIGAFVTGIVMVKDPSYPFSWPFWVAIPLSGGIAAVVGVMLSGPTLRLRGDYLALVTLGFGEVIRYTLRNLSEITGGTRTLSPAAPDFPGFKPDQWNSGFEMQYVFCLLALFITWVLVGNLERSRLGRAWVAMREDELAASCMGLNIARLKLAAFALGCFIAGMAGSILAFQQGNTADPDFYGFNTSINTLSCLILGGLGSRNGVLLGVFLLFGFDRLFADLLDNIIRSSFRIESWYLKFAFWKMGVFGLALILFMRFRPSGLLSSSREVHSPAAPAVPEAAK